LIVWLDEDPIRRGRIIKRAQLLLIHTKEAILFGSTHGIVSLNGKMLEAGNEWRIAVNKMLRTSSDEVRETAKRAELVGKWFAHTGNVTTLMSLIGVRP
jgi:hypothetical protein